MLLTRLLLKLRCMLGIRLFHGYHTCLNLSNCVVALWIAGGDMHQGNVAPIQDDDT